MDHKSDEIKLLDERCVLMENEIGHVCVRLFEKDGHYKVNSLAYMGRKLTDDEARRLTALWNAIETFLRRNTPAQANQETED